MTQTLMRKTLVRFTACVAALLLLATPMFYWLTKNFYAEDMIDIIEAVRQGRPVPALDLEQDIMAGIMIQFAVIVTVLCVAIVVTMRLISKRLWTPFNATLKAMEGFRLESGKAPELSDSDIAEFQRLNKTFSILARNCLDSYRIQREFTENASHELQTPLAVFQSRLDLLMQQPGLNERQAGIIQELYDSVTRLSRLNRNLLLLAKMENRQFLLAEKVDVAAAVKELLPPLKLLADGITINANIAAGGPVVSANRSLLESMISNLVMNAIRHNVSGGSITIGVSGRALAISNTSDGNALDASRIFSRFYRPAGQRRGNGLGLAIVKSVCDYHGWQIAYSHEKGSHVFVVKF